MGALTFLLSTPALRRWFDNPDDWDHLDVGAALLAGSEPAWTQTFVGDLGFASVRPLPTLLWALDRAVWGFTAGGYFATNVLLVAALAALVVVLVGRFVRGTAVAVAGGALVGLSVAANQPMYYLAARDDALANLLLVAALLAWVERRDRPAGPWITALLAFLSALCKPTAVLLPLALFALDRMSAAGERPTFAEQVRRQAPVLAALAVYLALLSYALGFSVGNLMREGSNRMGGGVLVALKNAVFPHLLPAYAKHGQVRVLVLDGLRFLLLGAVAWKARAARHPLVAVGVAVFLVGALPTLPFLASEGFRAQDDGRYLQLPAVGFALLVCGLLAGVRGRARDRFGWAIVGVSVATFLVAASPMLGSTFSPARALFETLDEVRGGKPVRVMVSRLDAGVTSLLASDVLVERMGNTRVEVMLQGGTRSYVSARGGARFGYWNFDPVQDEDLLDWSDIRLLVDGEEDGRPVFTQQAPRTDLVQGQGEAWTLHGALETRARLPLHSLWRTLSMSPVRPQVLRVPLVDTLETSGVCGAAVTLSSEAFERRGTTGGGGPLHFLVPTGRFALLLLSDEVEPSDPYEHVVVLPLRGEGRETVEVDLRTVPFLQRVDGIRWVGVIPSDRPARVQVERVELTGCP